MESFEIRPMQTRDLIAVWEIEKLCFSIPWTKNAFLIEIADNRCARYFAAHIDEKVIGYGGMWLMIDEAHITNIAVHPSYRKMGVGYSILKAMIYEALRNGADKMTLEVRVSNRKALNLYSRVGFRAEGVRKRYYSDNNEDALIMWKTIEKEALEQ